LWNENGIEAKESKTPRIRSKRWANGDTGIRDLEVEVNE